MTSRGQMKCSKSLMKFRLPIIGKNGPRERARLLTYLLTYLLTHSHTHSLTHSMVQDII